MRATGYLSISRQIFLKTNVDMSYYTNFNSMNNLLSYGGLVDERISASDKDLPFQRTRSVPPSTRTSAKLNMSRNAKPRCGSCHLDRVKC